MKGDKRKNGDLLKSYNLSKKVKAIPVPFHETLLTHFGISRSTNLDSYTKYVATQTVMIGTYSNISVVEQLLSPN